MAAETERGVSVVIPTVYRDTLNSALQAVAQAARRVPEPVEVIVVDDRQTIAAAASSREAFLDGVRVRNVRTLDAGVTGVSAARNLGAAHAAYDLIAFTDDDGRCDERWLELAVARLRADAGIAGVEGAVRIDPEHPLDAVRARIVMNLRGGGYLTASLFARAAAIRQIGGFRSLGQDRRGRQFPFREDTDFGLRLIAEVGPVPFVPEAFVLHPPEQVDLPRLVRLGSMFVADGALARLHPAAVPPIWRRPLARMRIRLATALTLLVPALVHRRTRRPAAVAIAALASAVSAQFEVELRTAGVRRRPVRVALDSARRLPRALLWSLAAGSARVKGEVLLMLGILALPSDPAGTSAPSR